MKDCNIVQDLLPSYIDELTNNETSKYIEEHLKHCSKCTTIYDNMKKKIKVDTIKKDNREVKYMKKFSKKLRLLKIILVMIVIVLIIILGRKAIIIKSMQGKIQDYKTKTNFHATTTSYEGTTLLVTDIYHKDGKFIAKVQTIGIDDTIKRGFITYYNEGKSNTYINNGVEKVAILNQEEGMHASQTVYNLLELNSHFAFIENLFLTNITSVNCNGKECYKISSLKSPNFLYRAGENLGCIYVEKKTGLLVRVEDGILVMNDKTISNVTDYFYEFDSVTDADLKEPDISEYRIQEEKALEKTEEKQYDTWDSSKVKVEVNRENLTDTSAEIVIKDDNEEKRSWWENFSIQILLNDEWKDLETKTQLNYSDKEYRPNKDGITTIDVNWNDVYGKLERGTYRIVKEYYDKEFKYIYGESFKIE